MTLRLAAAFTLLALPAAAEELCVEQLPPKIGDVIVTEVPQAGELRQTVIAATRDGEFEEITYEITMPAFNTRSERVLMIDHEAKEAVMSETVQGVATTQSYPYAFVGRHCFTRGEAYESEQVMDSGGFKMTMIYRRIWEGPNGAGGERFVDEMQSIIPNMPEQPPMRFEKIMRDGEGVRLTRR